MDESYRYFFHGRRRAPLIVESTKCLVDSGGSVGQPARLRAWRDIDVIMLPPYVRQQRSFCAIKSFPMSARPEPQVSKGSYRVYIDETLVGFKAPTVGRSLKEENTVGMRNGQRNTIEYRQILA